METGQIIFYTLLLALVGSAVLARPQNWGANAKMAAIWLVIILLVVGAATYWEDIANSKFAANLVPGHAIENEDGSVSFMKADDGHFHVDAIVNGKNIEFLLDTGASSISLTKSDAEKIGIDNNNLVYNKIYNTANGQVRGASVRLDSLEVGDILLRSVPASINDGEMDGSLLGMSFLNEMRSYKVEGNKLTIYP